MFSFDHLDWLTDTGETYQTADGTDVKVFQLDLGDDDAVLDSWAKHFRNNYCLDSRLDELRDGTGLSRSEFLTTLIFPCHQNAPGPSVRAGDFAEILVADYIEFRLGYVVPRLRWQSKFSRNESPKGSDIVGFMMTDNAPSTQDRLLVAEAKAKFSSQSLTRLQDAINDSAKDNLRIAETLNFLKRKYLEIHDEKQSKLVERFQNLTDNPYDDRYAAIAFVRTDHFDPQLITQADSTQIPHGGGFRIHPHRDRLMLLVFRGSEMMELVNILYKKAADEA